MLHKELATAGIINQKIIHTGQHDSEIMSGIFFKQLGIPLPNIILQPAKNIPADSFISATSIALQQYFAQNKDCIVLVYGDTNTTLAASLAATKIGLPLLHFEGGIRTGDNTMPEEINRIITDRLSAVNYCCTSKNQTQLIKEGYGKAINSKVILSGDLMYDAFLQIKPLEKNIIPEKEYIACTIHRAANILSKSNLQNIISGLSNIHKKIPVVMAVHPHTKKRMEEFGLLPSFTMLPPLAYQEMKTLLLHSTYVITDSGGAAREAYFCAKKSIVVMEKPFWPEIIEKQCSFSSIAESTILYQNFEKLPSLPSDFSSPIFGTGNAAASIKNHLIDYLEIIS